MIDASQDSAILRAIMDAAVDAMIVSDQSGTMRRVNAAAAPLFQFPVDDLIGESVNMLMPEALAALHDSFMAHHIATGEKRIIGLGRDAEGQRKDGTMFPLHLSVGNAQVGDQRIFIGILHDLTHRKATEAALARSQRLDAIDKMTSGIPRDFNNLLTIIMGNLEQL